MNHAVLWRSWRSCILHHFKNAKDDGTLNNVKVDDSFVKTGNSKWKNARSTDKGLKNTNLWNDITQLFQRLVEIPKTTQDVSTNAEKQLNRNAVWKRGIFVQNSVVFRYLVMQGLPFREHGDNNDSNFKQVLIFWGNDNHILSESLKKIKNKKNPTLPLKFKMKF